MLESPPADRAHGFGHNALPPELFAQPVTDLRRAAINVVFQNQADAASHLAANDNGEIDLRIFFARLTNPLPRVIHRVRMRKAVAHVTPDIVVVRVADK